MLFLFFLDLSNFWDPGKLHEQVSLTQPTPMSLWKILYDQMTKEEDIQAWIINSFPQYNITVKIAIAVQIRCVMKRQWGMEILPVGIALTCTSNGQFSKKERWTEM